MNILICLVHKNLGLSCAKLRENKKDNDNGRHIPAVAVLFHLASFDRNLICICTGCFHPQPKLDLLGKHFIKLLRLTITTI